MNSLSRKLAEMISSSPSGKRLLHPLSNLQYYALYSTTTRQKNLRKQNKTADAPDWKRASVRSTSEPPHLPPPRPATAAAAAAAPAAGSSATSDRHEWLMLGQRDAKPSADLPRPSEIPWQEKVVNSVNLIGSVAIPVQFQESPNGKYLAGTILSQENNHDRASIWIPLIFEGDLAHAAAFHLKEKDLVHIAGHLIGDAAPFNEDQRQPSIQVMVDSLSFVQESHTRKESCESHTRKESCESHTRNESCESHKQVEQMSNISGNAANGSSSDNLWRDLVGNPNQWWDNRKAKLQGSISPKFPDFKHKNSREALWIDTAPEWALLKLEKLEFDGTSKTSPGKEFKTSQGKEPSTIQVKESKTSKGNESKNKKESDEQFWKDVVNNPKKWWDNRSDKRNIRSPDFKHKDTGKGLWLSDSPVWVRDLLPPEKSVNTSFRRKDTGLCLSSSPVWVRDLPPQQL